MKINTPLQWIINEVVTMYPNTRTVVQHGADMLDNRQVTFLVRDRDLAIFLESRTRGVMKTDNLFSFLANSGTSAETIKLPTLVEITEGNFDGGIQLISVRWFPHSTGMEKFADKLAELDADPSQPIDHDSYLNVGEQSAEAKLKKSVGKVADETRLAQSMSKDMQLNVSPNPDITVEFSALVMPGAKPPVKQEKATEYKDKVLVMSLETDDEVTFFFSKQKQYDHDKGDASSRESAFYLWNSHQCPTNWIQDVFKVIVLDKQTGELNNDPHGHFRYVTSFYEGEMTKETYTDGNNKQQVGENWDADVMVQVIIHAAKDVARFFTLLNESGEELETLAPKIKEAWLKVMNNPHAMAELSRSIMEDGDYMDLAVVEGKREYVIDGIAGAFAFFPDDDAQWARIEEIIDNNLLHACNY